MKIVTKPISPIEKEKSRLYNEEKRILDTVMAKFRIRINLKKILQTALIILGVSFVVAWLGVMLVYGEFAVVPFFVAGGVLVGVFAILRTLLWLISLTGGEVKDFHSPI